MKRLAGEIEGALGSGEGLACLLQKYQSLCGQTHGAAGTVEECATDLVFEIEHLLADGGLRDVESARGGGKGTGVGDSGEVAKMP